MGEVEKIILTACTTLAGGVILLVLTELVKSFIMSPVQDLKKQVQIVLSKVDFHCNMLTNYFSAKPSDDELVNIRTIKKDLREAATDLKSKYTMVPYKNLLSVLGFVPRPGEIDVAYGGLIYLHNSILYEGRREYIVNLIEMNDNRIDRIHAALTGKTLPKELTAEQRSR